jgi:hypothetical protein
MIGNDHVRFGRGPSGKGLATASTSPDGLPRLHPISRSHADQPKCVTNATPLAVTLRYALIRLQPTPETALVHGIVAPRARKGIDM